MGARTWRAAPMALAAVLAGCGGGGGASVGVGLGLGFGSVRGGLEPYADTVLLAVVAFDAQAGPERLLATFPALPRPEAAVGSTATLACPAGGSVTAVRPDAGSYSLSTLNCRLRADDPLRYNGAWRWTFQANTYPASGSCAAGASCRLEALVDAGTAQFGYGSGLMQAVGGRWVQATAATGARSAGLQTLNERLLLSGGGSVALTGTLADLQVDLGDSALRVRGDAARQALQLQGPPSAAITLGPSITAQVDADGNGVAERSFDLPWGLLQQTF